MADNTPIPTVMECLKGYIGISSQVCEQPTPESDGADFSGLYIVDLPGISLESIEKIADRELKNFIGVWEKVESRALLKLRSAALAEVNKCFCVTDLELIDQMVCDNKELFQLALWYLIGSELCYERLYSNAFKRFTTIDRNQAAELRDDFLADYQASLKNAVKGIDFEEYKDESLPPAKTSVYFQESGIC